MPLSAWGPNAQVLPDPSSHADDDAWGALVNAAIKKGALPFFSVASYIAGGVPGTVTANKNAFQACQDALNATTYGGTFFVPAGFWDVGDWSGWRLPSDGVKCFVYQGETGTIVRNSTNLAAGVRFVDSATANPANINFFSKIRDMWIQGPGSGGSFAFGTSPAVSDGVAIYTRFQMENVRISGFRSGKVLRGDHFQLKDCEFFNNYYGSYCYQNLTGLDYHFDNCIWRANAMAGIGIYGGTVTGGSQGFLGGAKFTKGWFGSQPYAVYGEAQSTTLVMVVNCRFDQTSFENHSNGIFYCEGKKGSFQNVHFENCRTFSIGTTAQLPSTTGCRSLFYADRIGPISFTRGCIMAGFGNVPTVAYIDTNFITEGSLVWQDWTAVFASAQTAGIGFICSPAGAVAGAYLENSNGIARARAYFPSGTILAGDLVTTAPGGAVIRPTAYTTIEGVAKNTPVANELVVVVSDADSITVNTTATATNFSYVVCQDSSVPYAAVPMAMSSVTVGRPVIGKCTATATGLGGNMPIRLKV